MLVASRSACPSKLDRRQISAILQRESRTMPQHVRSTSSSTAGEQLRPGIPDGFIGECRHHALRSHEKEPGLWLFPPPVLAKCFEQLRTHRNIAIFAALPGECERSCACCRCPLRVADQFATSDASIQQHEMARAWRLLAASINWATPPAQDTRTRS